jgi:hypothetical protein
MSRSNTARLNLRSAFVRTCVRELSRLTGMTATEIVEDALRGYVPPAAPAQTGRLLRRGQILVIPANGSVVRAEEANAALDLVRER